MTNEEILAKIKQDLEGFCLDVEYDEEGPTIKLDGIIEFIVAKAIEYVGDSNEP